MKMKYTIPENGLDFIITGLVHTVFVKLMV